MNFPVLGDAVPQRGNWLTKTIGRAFFRLIGWRVDVVVPNIPKFIIIGWPHASSMDFVLGMFAILALDIRLSWMGKHTIFIWPVKYVLRWLGGFPVNRGLASGVVSQAVETFNEKEKFILGLMPEGTRANVKRWRTGFYYIALEAEVPILSIIFDYERKLLSLVSMIEPTGDITADLSMIQASFNDAQAG